MSGESMKFPADPFEFVKQYSFKDEDKIYTNGIELIPAFRVEQLLNHYMINLNLDQFVTEIYRNSIYIENIGEFLNASWVIEALYEYIHSCGWIDVKNSKPECETEVLILTKHGIKCIAVYEDGNMQIDDSKYKLHDYEITGINPKNNNYISEGWYETIHKYWILDNNVILNHKILDEVIAWQPLPTSSYDTRSN